MRLKLNEVEVESRRIQLMNVEHGLTRMNFDLSDETKKSPDDANTIPFFSVEEGKSLTRLKMF